MKEVDHERAMKMLQDTLNEMRIELKEVEEMKLSGHKKKMAHQMHEIYDQLALLVDSYDHSDEQSDLNHTFRQLEILKPTFVLNYNHILQ